MFLSSARGLRPLAATLVALLATACQTTPPAPTTAPIVKDHRGELVSVELVRTVPRDEGVQAANEFHYSEQLGEPACGVKVYRLLFKTVGVKGEPEQTSGAMVVPDGCPAPYTVMGLAPGTRVKAGDQTADRVKTFFAGYGYVIVMVDYLGLGASDYPYHPYLHADSEATAMIDGLRAAKAAIAQEGIPVAGPMVLTGASQGGHSVLATQRAIEADYADEFQIAAVMASSGPYSMTDTFLDGWQGLTTAGPNPLASILFSYTLYSYQQVYGNLYDSPTEVWQAPYSDMVDDYFPGPLNLIELWQSGEFPPIQNLATLREPAFVDAVASDPDHPFRQNLAANDLLDWTPKAPLLLCGSSGDAVVDFKNSETAYKTFKAAGANVTLLDTKPFLPEGLNGFQHHAAGGGTACTIAALKSAFGPVRQAVLTAAGATATP